jgi:hypothetical protein
MLQNWSQVRGQKSTGSLVSYFFCLYQEYNGLETQEICVQSGTCADFGSDTPKSVTVSQEH